MPYSRADHLAGLRQDIAGWKEETARLEKEGKGATAKARRAWIKSAQRLVDRLQSTIH
jgi:hypothetical protein